MKKEKKKVNRIWEIDFLRGVLIIGMMFDHFMFDLGKLVPDLFGGANTGKLPDWLNNFANFCSAFWDHPAKLAIRFLGLLLFFFLVGISSRFSKNNLKRGLLCTGFGVLMSLALIAVSKIFGIKYYALFPIITCLGVSMLLYWLFKYIFVNIAGSRESEWKYWSLVIGVMFVLTGFIMNLVNSTTGLVPGHIFITMMGNYTPGVIGSDLPLPPSEYFSVIIGMTRWGNDWLGLLPYVGFTFIGGFVGEYCYAEKKSLFFRKDETKNKEFNEKANKKTSVINWLGNKTIWIYIFHQVALIPIGFIFYLIGTGRWPF